MAGKPAMLLALALQLQAASCLYQTPHGTSMAGLRLPPFAPLRGGSAKEEPQVEQHAASEARRYQKRLTRSYSMSSVTPTAADPIHLEQMLYSEDFDMHVLTTKKEKEIEIKITSVRGAKLIQEQGGQLVLHWAVKKEEDDSWVRPPKKMLPQGTNYRYGKDSVHSNFYINEEGRAEVKLTVPDELAPRKIRFIPFHMCEGKESTKFWFKNSGEGDFEAYVCPDEWKCQIQGKCTDKEKNFFTKWFSKPRQPSAEVLEVSESSREPSPPREEPWHWTQKSAEVCEPFKLKLQRSPSEEKRIEEAAKRAAEMKKVLDRRRDDREYVKLSVMMPLDAHKWQLSSLERRFKRLKNAGVHGVMCDIWWGLVEQQPKKYDFSFYRSMAEAAQRQGLEIEFVMSFHKCGGNVGDNVYIPLPKWILSHAHKAGLSSVFYTDRWGFSNDEYISGAADTTPLVDGRSPVEMYADFMQAFVDNFLDLFHIVISKVQIGLGPAGELRYPSFPLSKWCYPGAGSFQCYDRSMREGWEKHCRNELKKSVWAHKMPDDGGYNADPQNNHFWSSEIHSDYGKAFMSWYSNALIQHGERVLKRASSIFAPLGVEISGKIAGLHWLYKTSHHGAECAAGYYNTNNQDCYSNIARMLRSCGATFDFTCMEIKTGRDDCPPYYSDPEALVWQAKRAAEGNGIKLAGENALTVDEWEAYDMILKKASFLDSFCFLRWRESMVNEGDDFLKFVKYLGRVKRPRIKQT